jgi:hypothetical protein
VKRTRWQFDVQSFGDDLNFIYVAITRAKKTLSLPKTIENLLRDFDMMHFCINDMKKAKTTPLEGDDSMIIYPKDKRKLTKGEVWALYHDLCLKLREELGVESDIKIMKGLFQVDDEDEMDGNDDKDDDDQIEIKSKEEDQSQYVDC